MKTKSYGKMTAEELAEATREFDIPSPAGRFGPLTAAQRRVWKKARRGRPAKKPEEKAARITTTIDPLLLRRADRFARAHGLTRAEMLTRGLKAVLAGAA